MNMKSIKLLTILMTMSPAFSYAQGHGGVGGGDQCKNEINKHRLEILGWIERDEAKDLDFSKARVKGLTYEGLNSSYGYKNAMLKALKESNVKVTCYLDPARISDPAAQRIAQQEGVSYRAITVDGSPSTCINYEGSDGHPHIDCNYDLVMNENSVGNSNFKNTHHEFATIAGIEERASSPSDMSVSNQLSEFERTVSVKFLGPKKIERIQSTSPIPRCSVKLGNLGFVGEDWVSAQLHARGFTVTQANDAAITLDVFNQGYMTTTKGCYAYRFTSMARSTAGKVLASDTRSATLADEFRLNSLSKRVAKRAIKAVLQSMGSCEQ